MLFRRGVKQSCIHSPLLFNLYSERIFTNALADAEKGIIIYGKVVNNIRYADDTLIMANSNEDLQILKDHLI